MCVPADELLMATKPQEECAVSCTHGQYLCVQTHDYAASVSDVARASVVSISSGAWLPATPWVSAAPSPAAALGAPVTAPSISAS